MMRYVEWPGHLDFDIKGFESLKNTYAHNTFEYNKPQQKQKLFCRKQRTQDLSDKEVKLFYKREWTCLKAHSQPHWVWLNPRSSSTVDRKLMKVLEIPLCTAFMCQSHICKRLPVRTLPSLSGFTDSAGRGKNKTGQVSHSSQSAFCVNEQKTLFLSSKNHQDEETVFKKKQILKSTCK